MRPLLLIFLLILNYDSIFGQNLDDGKYQFSRELFKSDKYKKSSYAPFKGKIKVISKNTYKFGEKVLSIHCENKSYELIFKKGIFNPDVVFGKKTTKKSQAEFNTLTVNQRVLYNLIRNDSL